MAVVKVNGIEKTYPEGTTYLEIARDFQDQYENDILLVRVNGKLRELEKTLAGDSEISFITAKENAGYKTYERSAIFLMLKAFYEVIPREKIKKIQIDFALGNGIYGELVGDIPVDKELLTSVKAHMEKLRDAAIPVKKRSVNTDDAVELFGKHGMHDKEQLFQYRRASRVNIYSIGEFEDYFYGYMVPDTSYVKYFDLVPCHAGFLLLLPVKTDPKHVEHPAIREKLFRFLPEFEIVIGDRVQGTVRKELTFLRPRYQVDYRGWDVEGDFLGWDYQVKQGGRVVMSISKELFQWSDSYILRYTDPASEMPGLLLVLAIDAANCSSDD